jgi:hypothetical protein
VPEVRHAHPFEPRSEAARRPEPIHASPIGPPIFAASEAVGDAVARAMRAIDAGDDDTGDALVSMICALRVPRRVAGFDYPRGCRIGRIRLAKPAPSRRVAEPVVRPFVAKSKPRVAAL